MLIPPLSHPPLICHNPPLFCHTRPLSCHTRGGGHLSVWRKFLILFIKIPACAGMTKVREGVTKVEEGGGISKRGMTANKKSAHVIKSKINPNGFIF